MKKARIFLSATIFFVSMILLTPAHGAGDPQDPVVALSYLTDTYSAELRQACLAATDQTLASVYAAELGALADAVGVHRLAAAQSKDVAQSAAGSTLLLKKGDQLTLLPGCQIMPKSGQWSANCSDVINVSAGYAVENGGKLYTGTLYMKNDADRGGVTVQSDTAELWVDGAYRLLRSSSPDYGSMAQALSKMGLFQGTGASFSLEKSCTRAEGLVMFLRIMGLEDKALAYTGTHPFTDVPKSHWAYRYVAYAYHNGLTKGNSAYKSVFDPEVAVSAQNYITFLMRALHYDEAAQFSYATVLRDCVDVGLFRSGEISTMSAGSFQRSKMVYLSYYALYGIAQDANQMLLQSLIDNGVVSQSGADQGICAIYGARLK